MAPAVPPRPAAGASEAGDERELVERLRSGDRQAFAALVDRHGGALLRLAAAFVRDPSLAEEVVQDAWLSALTGLDAFEGRSSLRTWLLRIVANKARTRFARERRSVPFSALAGVGEGDDPPVGPDRFDAGGEWRESPARWSEEDPERLAQAAETRAVVEQAVADLPETQRAVITLRDFEGLEAAEICELLGVTAANLRVLLHRARARVRRALEAYLTGDR